METSGNMFELNHNLKVTEIPCADFLQEAICTHPTVNNWCVWNSDLLLCENNYDSILFLSPWDVATMPKSVISSLILFGCMFIYWCAELILNNMKVFKRIEAEKRSKCQIYIFELIGVPIALSYLLYEGTFDVVFQPDKFSDMGPHQSITFLRSICSSTFILYMYAIEMLTNKLRWSLNLHHIAVIFTTLWFMALLDGSADIASIRCILAIALYTFTESNVFLQLLLYRLYPSKAWLFHAISAALYTFTRVFITITFIICYISWAKTDAIRDQISGNKPVNYVYISFFIIMPIATVLLNIAQIQTIKALWYLSKSVYKRQYAHEQLIKDIESIFTQYAAPDNGYWSISEWTKFVSTNTNCHNNEIYESLWEILLFDGNRDQTILTMDDFKRIFEPHIAQNMTNTKEVLDANSVKLHIAGKIEKLFQILSTSTHKHTVALRVHQHIRSLIDTQQSVLDLPEELEPIHSVLSNFKELPADALEMSNVKPTQVLRPGDMHSDDDDDDIILKSFHHSHSMTKERAKATAISISLVGMHESQMSDPPLTPFSGSAQTAGDHQTAQPDLLRVLSPLDEDHEKQYDNTGTYTPQELDLGSLNVPQPHLPIWYMNRSLTSDVSTIHREYTQNIIKYEEIPINKNIQLLFYSAVSLIYCVICALYLVNDNVFNAYHLVSFVASLSSAACILFYVKIVIFSSNLCYFEMKFKKINGVNYIPDGIVMDEGRSFDSVSMLSHARGTTTNKYFSSSMTLGSCCVFFGALFKMFDSRHNSSLQIAAVYILMISGFGGILLGQFEVYSSPTYSVRYNLIIGYLHMFGAFLYMIGGSLSFFLYSNGSIFYSIPLVTTIFLLFLYKMNANYRFKKDASEQTDDNYIKRTNFRSKINILMELVAFFPAVFSMCTVLHQLGKD